MAATDLSPPRAPSARRAWIAAYAFLWALTLATATATAVTPGAAPLVRHLLHLPLAAAHNPPPALGGVLSTAINNVLRGAWPLLLGPLDARRRPWTLAIADAAVIASLISTALLVGSALAAYDTRTLPYLPHLPIEYAGLAIGPAGWLIDRTQPLNARQRTTALALSTLVLLCAAGIETTLVPHR